MPKGLAQSPLTRRRWAPGWKMTLFAGLMLPVVVSLGFWQLERAALKRGYEARYFDRMAEPALAMPADFTDAEFLRVVLAGTFHPEQYFLVDNQIHDGRPGYWVVAVFSAEDGGRWLVNRGWTAAGQLREQLPVVETPSRPVRITGVLWPDMGMVPLLAEDSWPTDWPKRVQRLDVGRMAEAAEAQRAVEIRLESGQPGALVAATLGHDFKAHVHEGYAAQWFGLGLVLSFGYLIFGFRKHE